MVAALVLFDWLSAGRALFCVGKDPVDVFAFGRVLYFPLFDDFTVGRTVGFFATGKTEKVTAGALDFVDAHVWVLGDVAAAGVGAETVHGVEGDEVVAF